MPDPVLPCCGNDPADGHWAFCDARELPAVPALVLLADADEARALGRPICDQQLPIDGHPTRGALRCHLPARHLSQEHYDRALGTVWLPPTEVLIERPTLHG